MNTTASFSSEPSLSRRISTETVFSVQGQETDFVQDSSDVELGSDQYAEYEPVSGNEEEQQLDDTSGLSDNELAQNKVQMLDVYSEVDGDLQLADSEAGSYVSDSELDLPAYTTCAQCNAINEHNVYRYCDKCFQLRKKFFPPRPKRKKRGTSSQESVPSSSSQNSGYESLAPKVEPKPITVSPIDLWLGKNVKRRAESADRTFKRSKLDESDSEKEYDVAPLVKTVSDPSVTIEQVDGAKDLCIICLTEPKTGVFVHRRVAHICCCYKCAVKVWSKAKRCPVCNCKVSNVLKAVIM